MATEYAWAELTPEDRDHYTAERKAAHAEIGKLAILKSRINSRIKQRTETAENEAEAASRILRSGEHHIPCDVEVDHYEGKVRLYRKDNGKHVRTRPMTPLERQGRLDFDVDPPRGSSGKVADAPAKPEEPKPTPDPAVDQAAESPDAIAAEMARVMKGPIDIAKGLVERFGIEGATRVIDAIRGGVSAEEAFAQEDARRAGEAPKDAKPKKKGKPKKGNGKGSLRDALDGPEAEG